MRFTKIRSFIFWSLLCVFGAIHSQEEMLKIPDSLSGKSYDYLYHQYKKHIDDTISSKLYLTVYLSKAIITNDTIHKAIALNNLSYYVNDKETKLDYIQKSLEASNSVDSSFSVAAYNNLGLYYKDYYDYENAFTQYLRVLQLSKKNNYKTYEIIALTNIAELKTKIGAHKDALALYKICLDLEKKISPPDESAIIETSLSLAESLRNNKKHDSASYYYNSVIDKVRTNYPYVLSIALINEGINLYYKGDLEQAQILLEEGSSQINLNSIYYLKYYIAAQFYLGKIHQLSNQGLAKNYFLKIDSLLFKESIVIPEVRDAYTSLITDYEKNNNLTEQLSTINKLLKFDSITNVRRIKMANTLNLAFDTPELLKSKQRLIDKLESKNQNLNLKIVLLLTLFFFVVLLLFLQFRKHNLYRQRFDKIIKELNEKSTKDSKELYVLKTPSKSLNIDPDVVSLVLDKLKGFESKKGFLKSTITINSLASKLSTNNKYLSKIINTYKGKTFVHYINDLRIDYILQELKVNATLYRYTILGVAKEAGFNSAESFTAAFKKKTGITPSYYIKSLRNK